MVMINVVRFPSTLWYPHSNNSSTFRDPPAGNCDVAYWKLMVGPPYLGDCWWLYIPILIRVSSRPQFCFSYHWLWWTAIEYLHFFCHRSNPVITCRMLHKLIKEANYYNSTFYFIFPLLSFSSLSIV